MAPEPSLPPSEPLTRQLSLGPRLLSSKQLSSGSHMELSDSEDEAPPAPPPSLPRDGDAFDAAAAAARDTAAAAARFVRARLPAPSPPGSREPRVEAI